MEAPQQQGFPKQVLEQFNGDCCPSQVPQRISSTVVPSLSFESQIYSTDACSMKRSKGTSSDSDIGSKELPNSVDINNHTEFQQKVPMDLENKVEQEPNRTTDGTENHATECFTDDSLRPTTKESGGTSNEDELEHRFPKSHVDMVSHKLEPTMDGAKIYTTEPDAEESLKLKDMQIKLLKEELEIVKEDHACLQKTTFIAIQEMKKELRAVNDERLALEKRYIAVIENMKQGGQKWNKKQKQ